MTRCMLCGQESTTGHLVESPCPVFIPRGTWWERALLAVFHRTVPAVWR
jgi:hypothetical protein